MDSSELLNKTPSQSRMTILYNFTSDCILREQYKDALNEVRIGKLLQDLDALAATISVKHCSESSDDDSTTRPLDLVTASVDRITLKKFLSIDADLKIAGSVTWVGRSSIGVQLDVTQPANETVDEADSVALTANFIFVARDSKTGKAAPVNRLTPQTDREKLLYREAEARSNIRNRKIRDEECEIEVNKHVALLLALGRVSFDMPASGDGDSILLKHTGLEHSLICQPQQRNNHGRIFGGFLMHRAFKLAFSTAYAFAGMKPSFVEVDHVDFPRPVDVGDFLRLKSCVLFTGCVSSDLPLIHVEVVAYVTKPEFRSNELSTTFYFIFTVRREAKAMDNGHKIRRVLPTSDEEAQRVIECMIADSC